MTPSRRRRVKTTKRNPLAPATRLTGKTIVLGVTGSIAAYKAASLARRLMTEGATVRVVMTHTAQRFVGAVTFEALTGRPVFTDLFESETGEVGVGGARVPVAPSNATGDGPPPTLDVTFDVVCSKGTYVRTLCADIGELLGVGGHLAGLERRRVGRFGIEQALGLDELAGLADRGAVETRLYTLKAALADLPALHVDRDAVEGLRHGVAVPVSRVVSSEGAWMAGAFVRLLSPDGRLVGIGKAPCSAEALKQAQPGAVIKLEKVLA